MIPTVIDLADNPIVAGCDWQQDFEFVQENGQPVDFTGAQAQSQLKTATGQSAATFIVTFPVTGKLRIELDRDVTFDLQKGKHNYDVLVQEPSSKRYQYIKGSIPVEEVGTQWQG